MSERLFELPETIITMPVADTFESKVQSRDIQLQLPLPLGAYAIAIYKGETEGLIGSDIFPDDGEGF